MYYPSLHKILITLEKKS